MRVRQPGMISKAGRSWTLKNGILKPDGKRCSLFVRIQFGGQ
jgi:hypothetical protein